MTDVFRAPDHVETVRSASHSLRLKMGGPVFIDSLPTDFVNISSRESLFSEIEERLGKGQGFALATLNLDHIVKQKTDSGFRVAYAAQDLVVADGNPVVWMRRLAKRPVELIPGSELILPLSEMAARCDVPIMLLGSKEEVLARAAEHLEATYPGLKVEQRIAPCMDYDPNGDEAKAHLEDLNRVGTGLCFLALGAPKQEQFAARGRDLAPGIGFVSVGAGLDFLAGDQRRAPLWMRKVAMEWLWRMASDPKRLVRRYIDCARILPGLTLEVCRQRSAKASR